MGLPAQVARRWLRMAAVMVVLLLGAGLAYGIEGVPPTYLESASVLFSLPKSKTNPNAYYYFAPSLIMSGEGISQLLANQQVRGQIRRAGGTADVNLALINLYNEEYPEYGEPLATLTSSSPSAASTHRTFRIAKRLLDQILNSIQANAGVPVHNRISAQIFADTGPIIQQGSSKRVYAGIALLAAIGTGLLWGLVDRRVSWRSLPLPGTRDSRRRGARLDRRRGVRLGRRRIRDARQGIRGTARAPLAR
jgi:hypothetical protein